MARADELGVLFPACMTLATASPDGRPSARTVIVKGWDLDGLLFETQSFSRKGLELSTNPFAALTIHWREVHRQITATGSVEVLPPDVSDEMWARRPRANRAAGIVSDQGAVVSDLGELEAEVSALLASDDPLERPPTYQAHRVVPDTMEFWEGSDERLHRRLFYERTLPGGEWRWRRLQP